MKTFIGIDLGTSGVKLLLVDEKGNVLGEQSEGYAVSCPQPNWSEQSPMDWYAAAMRGLKTLVVDTGAGNTIRGISLGGQMHGLVTLDKDGNVIRPCILWNDGRTQKQTDFLNEHIGKKALSDATGNIAFAGFTAPKLLWLRENEPENFARIHKILLPKDYLIYRLCGVISTDYSDASGTLLLDVKNKKWSDKMCEICGIRAEQLPTLRESFDVVGTLKKEIAGQLGLSEKVIIAAGAGDNAAAAVGTGTVGGGACNVSLGTSGTIFLSGEKFAVDEKNALHSFCHADGRYHVMGCILSAASARKWWLEDVLGSKDYAGDEREIEQTAESDVFFLPYLTGERSPHNDVNARGAFIGLSATTSKAQMSRAVMEGVVLALKDCLEVAKKNGMHPNVTGLCGGGAKSKVWRQIVADVLDLPVRIPQTEQGPAYGAAMLAMVGCGVYASVADAVKNIVKVKETIMPEKERVKIYGQKYQIFTGLYPALKTSFRGIKP